VTSSPAELPHSEKPNVAGGGTATTSFVGCSSGMLQNLCANSAYLHRRVSPIWSGTDGNSRG
jgi:hypothetical protein